MKNEEFKPFAEEWEKEIKKITKTELIREILKPALIRNKELTEAIKEFALNKNPERTEFDNGYNQALENLDYRLTQNK